jgi:hypothetical protein
VLRGWPLLSGRRPTLLAELGVTGRCSRCWRLMSKSFERLDTGQLALIEGCARCRKAEQEERAKRKARLLEECREGGKWS